MPQHEKDRAEGYGLACTKPAIGNDAADDRHKIDERGIGAVDQACLAVGKQEVLCQVEN